MKNYSQLARCRKAVPLTQEELAEKLNVTRQTVSKWESGLSEPDTDTLLCMSEIFGVSVDEILRGEERKDVQVQNFDPVKDDPRAAASLPSFTKEERREFLYQIFHYAMIGLIFLVNGLIFFVNLLREDPHAFIFFGTAFVMIAIMIYLAIHRLIHFIRRRRDRKQNGHPET